MKKLLVLVLALILVSSAAFAEVNLTVTSWRTDDKALWDQINTAFTEEYPDITVEFLPVTATEYDGVLQTKLSSGNAEDIMFLRAFSTGRQIFDAGYVLPLTTDDVPNLVNFDASFQNPWATEDGTVYGVPGSVCYGGFFYNKAIFEQCGVEVPKTWDEFMTVCQTIADAGITPIAFGIKDSWMVAEYLSATIVPMTTGGKEWHTKLMNREVDYNDPGYIKHFEWIKQLAQYFPEGYEGIGYDDMQMMFCAEMAAIYPVGTFELGVIEGANPDLDLGWFYMPGETADEEESINFGAIMGYGINAKLEGEKLEAAKTYVNWLADVKASEMFTNLVVGQYAASAAFDQLDNAMAMDMYQQIADIDAARGVNFFQQMPYEKLSDQSPDYTSAISEAVYKLLVEGISPEEAAQFMMDTQAWYFE
ncbi:MAG: extracellular solute-binding protein [Clostridia bacterium]|nr:extracellular solute-binding protein [Clostridia bacterium]